MRHPCGKNPGLATRGDSEDVGGVERERFRGGLKFAGPTFFFGGGSADPFGVSRVGRPYLLTYPCRAVAVNVSREIFLRGG